ncbi:MAG TPA: hypothetical protein VFO16_20465 [Pseudonocardiaceae bacterium]|nr:hypothetical protein [Pseudonocardiaceae bacterium]
MSMRAKHGAIRQKRTQRKVDPNTESLGGRDASRAAAERVASTPVTLDDFAHHRADALDAEAAYYRRRAIQERQALGPGYYVDLLWAMATDRAATAQRIRAGKTAKRDQRPPNSAGLSVRGRASENTHSSAPE